MKESKGSKENDIEFELQVNLFIKKLSKSIESFQFNVSIALFYEVYKVFKKALEKKLAKKTLVQNMIKIMKLLIPFTPHLAHECLSSLGEKNFEKWPKINELLIEKDIKIKMPIQINGKTRDILDVKKDLSEREIFELVVKSTKVKKYMQNKKIFRTIFVKNKIVNYIIK